MTFSRRPWSLDGNRIKDANGNIIGDFFDGRNSEQVVEAFNDTDDRSRKELQQELVESTEQLKELSDKCDKAVSKLDDIMESLKQ